MRSSLTSASLPALYNEPQLLGWPLGKRQQGARPCCRCWAASAARDDDPQPAVSSAALKWPFQATEIVRRSFRGVNEMALASLIGCGLRYGAFGLVAVMGLTIATKAATARNNDIGHKARATHSIPADSSSPLGSSIVVDGNTGATLEASKPNALRHPASLTKIMTLYLLFERMEQRTIGLDTQLRGSEKAASQAPTKLGLKAGQTIAVEDAIKAMVTKSANDAAVTVAENLGGDGRPI